MNPKTIHPKGLNGDNFDPIVQRETKELFAVILIFTSIN
jgi:hypothetical protein